MGVVHHPWSVGCGAFFLLLIIFSFFHGASKRHLLFSSAGQDKELAAGSSKNFYYKNKKNVIIFSSNGGGGHATAAKFLKAELEAHGYTVSIVHPFRDGLADIDPIRFFSGGMRSCEDFYNEALRHGFSRIIYVMSALAPSLSAFHAGKICKHIETQIIDHKAAFVISVIPFINGFIQEACKRLAVNAVLIPTDLDLRTFLKGVKPEFVIRPSLRIIVPFKDPCIDEYLDKKMIPKVQVLYNGGFPVRSQFFQLRDKEALRVKWGIEPGKKVIALMMGAVGANEIWDYTLALASGVEGYNIHLFVCVGKNNELAQRLARIIPHKTVTIRVLPYVHEIDEIFRVANVIVTKPGTLSVMEAITIGTPVIPVYYGSMPLTWEAFNYSFVERCNVGRACKSPKKLASLCRLILDQENHFQAALDNFPRHPLIKNLLQYMSTV